MSCYRHPDRRAGVRCQRCERAICPDCMRQASVGFHCPECVRAGGQKVLRGPQLRVEPTATQALIGINVALSLVALVSGGGLSGVAGDLMIDYALWGPAVRDGELWRIVTSGFLHAGLLHLAFNMYALWILGAEVERGLGRRWFLATYGISLLAGSFGALLLDPDAFTVGASGAIFGLFGLIVVVQRARGIDIWASGMGPVLLINLALTFGVPGISVGGHLGGLAAGLVMGTLLVEVKVRRRQESLALGLAAAVAVACVLGSVWAAEAATPIIFFGR